MSPTPRFRAAMVLRATALALLLLAGAAGPAAAHDAPYSFLDLRADGARLEGRLIAHVFDVAHEVGVVTPDSILRPERAAQAGDSLRRLFDQRLVLLADGDTLRLEWTWIEPVPERDCLAFGFRAPLRATPGRLAIEARLFPYDPEHETYVNVYVDGALRLQELLDARRPQAVAYGRGGQGAWAVFRTFAASGIHHIFIGPDHILFIVGLILLGGGVMRLLKIVTAFTLAHSVTLALAALEIVRPSPRIIEPAIALSIVAIGVENLVAANRGRDWRVPIAFSFGLLHGFGFASVLREFGLPREALGWALVSFNLGVEMGQACIVGIAAPLLAWIASGSERGRRGVVVAGSWGVVVAGAWWLVERTLLSR